MTLRILSAAIAVLLLAFAPQQSAELDKALKTIKAADIQKHQAYLASDALEGREAGSEGGHKASLHIVQHLMSLGFKGGASDGGFFQTFGGGGGGGGNLADVNWLHHFKDASRKTFDDYKLTDDFIPLARSGSGAVEGAVVIVGFGITATEHGYDDWKGAPVKGAIALAMEGEPQESDEKSKFDGTKPTKYSDILHKVEMAEKAGAGALVLVTRTGLASRPEFAWPPPADTKSVRIPVLLVAEALGDKLAGKPLKDIRAGIDGDLKPRSAKSSQTAGLLLLPRPMPGKGTKNVLALWPGSDAKLKEEYVVLGAHYDHVGRGQSGSNGGKKGEIHNGADDNGSGTSTLLEIAEAIRELSPKRSYLLMWFDAEEKGLVGSKHWCDAPTVKVESVVAMFNLDMIGRNDTGKILIGLKKDGSSPTFAKLAALIAEGEKRFGLKFDWNGADQFIQRSDHWHFMEKGIPAAFFFAGLHADYHTDRDDVEKINFPKEELIGKLVLWLSYRLVSTKIDLR